MRRLPFFLHGATSGYGFRVPGVLGLTESAWFGNSLSLLPDDKSSFGKLNGERLDVYQQRN
jgi:hypothetical protein